MLEKKKNGENIELEDITVINDKYQDLGKEPEKKEEAEEKTEEKKEETAKEEAKTEDEPVEKPETKAEEKAEEAAEETLEILEEPEVLETSEETAGEDGRKLSAEDGGGEEIG